MDTEAGCDVKQMQEQANKYVEDFLIELIRRIEHEKYQCTHHLDSLSSGLGYHQYQRSIAQLL